MVAIAGPALGATCVGITPREALESAHVVALGNVTAVRSPDLRVGGEIDFKVHQAIKGTDAGRTLTVALAVDGSASVGYWIAEPGTWHTLYLRPRAEWPAWPEVAPKSVLYTSMCFGSHEGPPTDEEQAAFGTGPIRLPDRHPSGIAIVPRLDLREITPMPEPLAYASSAAWELAEQDPDAFGPPWTDRTAGQVILAVVEGRGEDLARSWIAAGAPRTGSKPTPPLAAPEVPVRIRWVERSFAELRRIQDELTYPEPAGHRGESRIWAVAIDGQHDRVLLETDRLNDELLHAIANTYGTEAVAVRVDPSSGPFTMPQGSPWSETASALNVIAAVGGFAALIAVGILLERVRRSAH